MKSKRQLGWIVLALTALVVTMVACGPSTPKPTETPNVPPTAAFTPTFTPIPLINVVKMVSNPTEETGKSPDYTIKAQTPFLQGSEDQRVINFNNEMLGLTQEEVAKFKDNARVGVKIPGGGGSGYQQTYEVLSPAGNVLSIKFDINIYIAGAAHPVSHSRTVTYDLEAGSDVSLDQLFTPGSSYLDLIANYCVAQLKQMNIGYDPSMFTGAQPHPENYTNWNITAGGLLITFDEYQVAAYAAGPQAITVPYAELKPVIDPHGPLAGFLP